MRARIEDLVIMAVFGSMGGLLVYVTVMLLATR